jgi:hypothetical protein
MPDIKSELSKVLNEWDTNETVDDKPKGKRLFPVQNNVSHETYNYIHANPGLTTPRIVKAMVDRGFKASSVSSLVYQMHLVGRVRKDKDSKVFSIKPILSPIKASEIKAARKAKGPPAKPAKPKKQAAPSSQGIAALAPQATEPKQPAPTKAERITVDLDEWINEVPLMQARMVYLKLKAIFEGGAA